MVGVVVVVGREAADETPRIEKSRASGQNGKMGCRQDDTSRTVASNYAGIWIVSHAHVPKKICQALEDGFIKLHP